ncbi:MAG: ATP-binding cassette domain-containing protein [Actinobacteria bacterium]|nr:ATP-binding cassette domain-containing protein [Actinomycetota bacterium]
MTVGYGRQPVVHGVDIHVDAGEVVALLGANGAGKTTTLFGLCGELPLIEGEVQLGGRRASGPLQRRARMGLGFVAEERSVFKNLTAAENLRVGRVTKEAMLELFPEFERCLDTRGGLLSGGEQQMLSLGRALCREPKVLVADELSLGLAPLMVTRLLEALRAAADQRGIGILLVEQHIRQALRYADRALVIRRGRIVLSGTARELEDDIDEVERSYLSLR